jgi:hypothetical protein
MNQNEICKVLDLFKQTENLFDILNTFDHVKTLANLSNSSHGLDTFYELKKLCCGLFWFKSLCSTLESKLKDQEYSTLREDCKSQDIVIIGAGPAGLVSAIECAIMGANVNVIEKRTYISRNNILHLWPFTMHYLTLLGAKKFYPKFGTGGIDHIGTKQIQRVLLKIALILGVKVHYGYQFCEVIHKDGFPTVTCTPDLYVRCNLLIGGDGVSSTVAQKFNFARKKFSGTRSIGMTFNFANHHTSKESSLREFGLSRIFEQKFFQDIEDKYSIELENLVYYRGETHYFVMTIKKKSLLQRDGFIQIYDDISELLHYHNLKMENLISVARDVATFCGVPVECEMVLNQNNTPDLQLFDFSECIVSDEAIKYVPIPYEEKSSETDQIVEKTESIYVALVGDSLIEPFWPLGTGCNRAILSALDTTWMVRDIVQKKCSYDVINARQNSYSKMKSCLAESFKSPFKCCLSPLIRYGPTSLYSM